MKKLYGGLLIILSVLLIVWSLLSLVGLVSRLSTGLPADAYSIGVVVGKVCVIVLFSLLGKRAFQAGKSKIRKQASV